MLSYAGEVFSGERSYPFALPAVPGPGAIGRVQAVGNDATQLKPGDWVFCDPTIRARDSALAPDIMLQGLIAPGPGPARLRAWVGDGGWAEQIKVPTENAAPLGPVDPATALQWCALGTLLVPFGGLLAAELQAGETLLLHGATGSFGSAGVAVALAMGAGCVVAPGRNQKALADLVRRFGSERVRTVVLGGDAAADHAAMQAAAARADRLRARHHAALGAGIGRACRRDDGAPGRPRGSDGRRRHGRRRRALPSLPLAHAQRRQRARAVDVSEVGRWGGWWRWFGRG